MNKTTTKELAHTVGDFINAVIAFADENNADRDKMIRHAAEIVMFVAQTASFRTYELIETSHDKHWNECRQIALYDDQIKRMQEHIDRLKGVINALYPFCGGQNNGS